MLESISIRHFAIIDSLDLDFKKGLNILSGETGAGKSIIMQALTLILGGRAYSDLIRTGEDECEVSAVFDISKIPVVKNLLQKQDYNFEDQLIIRRVMNRSGKGRIWLNDKASTASTLQDLGKFLIDLVSQNESQKLFDEGMPRIYLDQFAEHLEILAAYQEKYHEYLGAKAELGGIETQMKEAREREDLYRYQLQEIRTGELRKGEEEELLQDRKILANASKITENLTSAEAMLYSASSSATELVGKSQNLISKFEDLDPSLEMEASKLSAVCDTLDEVSRFLQNYLKKIDYNPQRLLQMEERLDVITSLKKKYGGSTDAILEKEKELSAKVGLLENQDEVIEGLKSKLVEVQKTLLERGQRLRSSRIDAAKKLSKLIEKELAVLAMPSAKFEVRVLPLKSESENIFSPSGMDEVLFYISPNKGEELKPMNLIVSGGELSRILLALKSVTRDPNSAATFVFDEVDTGIGGAVAEGVGQKLKKLAQEAQVLCITHLPQIAACGNTHYQISKVEKKERTSTQVKLLDESERIDEIARMLAGVKITEKALSHAKELIKLMS